MLTPQMACLALPDGSAIVSHPEGAFLWRGGVCTPGPALKGFMILDRFPSGPLLWRGLESRALVVSSADLSTIAPVDTAPFDSVDRACVISESVIAVTWGDLMFLDLAAGKRDGGDDAIWTQSALLYAAPSHWCQCSCCSPGMNPDLCSTLSLVSTKITIASAHFPATPSLPPSPPGAVVPPVPQRLRIKQSMWHLVITLPKSRTIIKYWKS
jgi:hypothetical protein